MNAALKPDAHLSPLRKGRITGSRVAAVLGLNPYSTRADVLREMVRQHFDAQPEFTGNDATRYGQDSEPMALKLYEQQTGTMTYGGGALRIHPLYDFLAVTPDGLIGDHGMVECKAPFRANYTHYSDKPHYVAQMQLQMACTGRPWCDFVVLDRTGKIHVSRLDRNPDWIAHNLGTLQNFMDDFADALANPAPHLAERERDDADWARVAGLYLTACERCDQADADKEIARRALLALAGDMSVRGCGVQVIRSERAGSVAYAQALKSLAPGADLSSYTGAPSVVFTIKETR